MKKFKRVWAVSLTFFCLLLATSYTESSSVTENLPNAKCTNPNGCYSEVEECKKKCGCDRIYKIDESTGECTLDYDYLKERTRATNVMHTGEEIQLSDDDGLAKKIRERNDRIFTGILYCALFIVVCACICVISACIFCCEVQRSDEKLKNEVKALAVKMNVDFNTKKSMKKKPRDPKEESCNVIVEDANIMCV